MELLKFTQLLDQVTVTNPTDDPCHGIGFLVNLIRNGLFPILQIGIPIILIVLGTIDLGKAVISSDEKEVKAAQGRLLKRCIYAVAVFFIVTIVSLLFNLIANVASEDVENATGWAACWNLYS